MKMPILFEKGGDTRGGRRRQFSDHEPRCREDVSSHYNSMPAGARPGLTGTLRRGTLTLADATAAHVRLRSGRDRDNRNHLGKLIGTAATTYNLRLLGTDSHEMLSHITAALALVLVHRHERFVHQFT